MSQYRAMIPTILFSITIEKKTKKNIRLLCFLFILIIRGNYESKNMLTFQQQKPTQATRIL